MKNYDVELHSLNSTEKLQKLGLTKQESRIYVFLLQESKATAKSISLSLRIPIQAVYRSCHNLSRLGFLGEQKVRPIEFIVVPEKLSISSHIRNREKIFENITRELFSRNNHRGEKASPTKVNLVFGEKEMFESSARSFKAAKNEILVISIGQELPPELLLAQKNAVQRGVVSRMIAHKNDQENQQVLRSFKANGIEVQHFKDKGYHMVIVDGKVVMVASNNPKNTKERVGIEFFNEALAGALRDYFYSVWEKSKLV